MKRTLPVCVILLCWLLAGPCPTAAQEDVASDTMLMFVGEKLYTISAASRREESIQKAPAAVTVLGRKELKRYRTLAEALRSVPGFYVDHTGVKENVYLRGVANSFLVMIDGVPLANDSSNEDYPRGMELSLDYIEKIEIVKGPGSALWGADAFSGVVNVVTRQGKDVDGIIVSGGGGSWKTTGGNVTAGYKWGSTDAVLFCSVTESEGFEPDHSGESRQKDSFKELYGKVTIHDRLTISGRYSRYKDYFTINFLDRHTGLHETPFSFIQASYTDTWWGKVDASLKVYTHHFRNYEREAWRFRIPQFNLSFPVETRLNQDNWRYGIDAKFDTTVMERHLLTVGCSWEYDDGSSTQNSLNSVAVLILPRFRNSRMAFYLQDKIQLADKVEIVGGVRLDKHENYRRKISPRLALSWFPDDWVDVKLFYGQAFRTPDLFALTSAENVKPEKIESFEGEITVRWKRGITFQGNYFYYILDDLLENVTQGLGRQSRREIEEGTEVTFKISPFNNLSLYASHTFLFGERQRNDPRRVTFRWPVGGIPGGGLSLDKIYHVAPDHVFKAGGTYAWHKKYSVNVEVNYIDSRDIGEEFYGTSRSGLSPYWTTDVNVLAEGIFGGRMDFALRIRNLFNEHFKYRGENELFTGEDRSIFVSLGLRF
ncbi:MAG: TonB-dependent receptor [Deltaproteobacteria bacterium]|nr:TonB-dependent receptor [Deltaproteobacteria bacterium]